MSWAKGPQPPRVLAVRPWLPAIQEAPLNSLHRVLPNRKARAALLLAVSLFWISIFTLLLRKSKLPGTLKGYGELVPVDCVETFWLPGNGCGLDGVDCRPFNGIKLPFRCPAHCASVKVLNPRAVGAEEINYRPLVIGGPIYRGDSFICGSAIHAGVIKDSDGGCGVVSRVGQHRDFRSTEENGIKSIAFDSYFPQSFKFEEVKCEAKDLRWPLLLISVAFTVVMSLFTTSPAVCFGLVFAAVFAQVGLVSDPPPFAGLGELVSDQIGKFLPAAFCALAIYRSCVKLEGLTAQIDKTVLWLGGCWFGALSNYTFESIPISRLTPHDLEQQPGAKLALAIILLILILIIAQQIWYFRLEGRLLIYLALYAVFILGIIFLLAIPNLNLRIHHYILALLLLPGTSMQTRPSLLYQGILIGLFINGIARWGFDPVLQSDAALRGDAQLGSSLPILQNPTIALGEPSNITFDWQWPVQPRYEPLREPLSQDFDGVSVLVNDVERYRRYVDEDLEPPQQFTWTRDVAGPEYFRFAYMRSFMSLDYTKAGIWDAESKWIEMAPGPSF